jgi:hypothetical protein
LTQHEFHLVIPLVLRRDQLGMATKVLPDGESACKRVGF